MAKAEEARRKVKEAHKRAEDDMIAIWYEHSCYFQEALPTVLDQNRQQAVVDYQRLAEFKAHLLAEYKEGMRDMKAGFSMPNLTVTRGLVFCA